MHESTERSGADRSSAGSVASLWRYPVKSMLGEQLNESVVTARGLLGDREYALLDSATGRVASAKNPRKWKGLFDFRATLSDSLRSPRGGLPVRITLPDGTETSSDDGDVDLRISRAIGAGVRLVRADPDPASYEEYWPDIEGLPRRDQVTVETMPPGTFFDCAVVHLITTSTLGRFRELYPEGRFDVRRYRPNVVLELSDPAGDFVENDWVGRTVALGEEVRLRVTGLCGRCVMTTLPQRDLPRDVGILRTVARHNRLIAGAYASVERTGTVRRGDACWLV
jgi:uncharacterized protein YcbX